MALIDKASLLMVPSTYEAGKLYNVLPSGNRAPDSTGENSGYDQTRADFDFDRGTNAAATRVNADGLIEKYRENLFTYSNDFSNSSWVKYQGGSVTSGQADKDGGTNAWKLNVVSSQSFSGLYKAISGSSVCTISVYAKAGTLDRLGIVNMSGVDFAVWFDLTNGTIGTQGGSNIDAKIEAVGTDGWYRVSFTQLLTSGDYFQLKPSDGETTPSGADGFIYIMNAQLETGLVATEYLESTSVTGKAGVLIDLPRIDYSSGAGALLLEPSRQQLVQFSEYHSGTYYGNNKVTTTDNQAISPEGVQNAAKIVLDNGTNTSNGGHHLSFSSTGGTTYTISVFAKAAEMRYFTFTYGSAAAGGGHFDLQEGTLLGTITNSAYSNETASIEDYGNGWYRLVVSLRDNASVSGRFISMKPSPSASVPTNNNYPSTGDGTSGAYIYGFQVEASATYPSSYIPNHGTSGGVTRAADSCSVTGASDVIGQTEGTILWDVQIDTPVATANESLFNIDAGGFGNTIYLIKGATGNIVGEMYVSSAAQASFTLSGISSGNYKIAFAYAQNNTAMFVNGVQVGATDTSCNVPAMSRIQLGNGVFGPSTDKTKQLALFNERLSNAELAALTA